MADSYNGSVDLTGVLASRARLDAHAFFGSRNDNPAVPLSQASNVEAIIDG